MVAGFVGRERAAFRCASSKSDRETDDDGCSEVGVRSSCVVVVVSRVMALEYAVCSKGKSRCGVDNERPLMLDRWIVGWRDGGIRAGAMRVCSPDLTV